MATDLQTFTLAFVIVWGGLAAYLVRLHMLARRLQARVEALEATTAAESARAPR